jgi:hypothetical protein
MDGELERIWKGPFPVLRHYIANCFVRWGTKTKEHAKFVTTVYYKNNCSQLKKIPSTIKSDYRQH